MTTIVGWILTHKLLLFLITASTAFGISTIALGVSNTNLSSDLDACREEITTESTSSVTSTTVSSTTEVTTDPPEQEDMSKYRLSGKVLPASYNLYLYPNLESANFTGKVDIVIDVIENVDAITLHSNKLTISRAFIDNVESTFEVDETYELLNIYASNKSSIGTGKKTLTIEFGATMKDKIVGLYQSTYTNEDGEQR